MRIESLPGNHDFGVMVHDLAPDDLGDADIRAALKALWIDKGLIVFRGMAGAPEDGRDTQFRLSEVFGEAELHPIALFRQPDRPEITPLAYEPGKGIVTRIDGKVRGGAQPWHSDLVYMARINRGGLLRVVQMPSHGGATGFVDQIALYDALPGELRKQVEGLHVLYHFDPRSKAFGKPVELISMGAAPPTDPADFPVVSHPMVYTQAETGRKVLNVSPWFALGIEEMPGAEGDALLRRIVAFCEDDARAYHHRWQAGDMVLWDNWRMLHNAEGAPVDEVRRVERITLKGDYALGRLVREAAKPQPEHVPV